MSTTELESVASSSCLEVTPFQYNSCFRDFLYRVQFNSYLKYIAEKSLNTFWEKVILIKPNRWYKDLTVILIYKQNIFTLILVFNSLYFTYWGKYVTTSCALQKYFLIGSFEIHQSDCYGAQQTESPNSSLLAHYVGSICITLL